MLLAFALLVERPLLLRQFARGTRPAWDKTKDIVNDEVHVRLVWSMSWTVAPMAVFQVMTLLAATHAL